MSDEVRNALPRGFSLNEYRILSVLGDGGFGITYLAEDDHLGRRVAIKEYLPTGLAIRHGRSQVLPKSMSSEPDFVWGLQEFLREAQTLAHFAHPNIVEVLRYFEDNGTAYIVMAFQDGENLFDLIDRKGRLDQAEIEHILFPLIDGLSLVHEHGFLHRDIKPENVFIRGDGTPVLLDFGAARQALGNKTRTLTSIVSRGFAPFEQYTRSSRQGAWTDIYALAAVIYMAIAGRPPPDAPDRREHDEMVPAAEAGRDRYDRDFLKAIDRALSVKAEDRPQTLAEWREMLLAGARGPAVPAEDSAAGLAELPWRPGPQDILWADGKRERAGPGPSVEPESTLSPPEHRARAGEEAPGDSPPPQSQHTLRTPEPSVSSAGAEPSQAEEALDRGTRVLGPVEAPPAAKGRAQPQRRPTSLGLAVLVFLVMFGAGAGGAALWTLSGAGWPDLDLGGLGSAPPASDPQAARQPAAASEADGESASEAEVAAAERAAEVEARRQQAEEEAALEEARRQAEAKRRAEAEAKRKAEQEARKRAEAEIAAQRRAQEEARRRVEAEAEKQAEAELRRKAEEQARRQAEAEALAKAETAAAAEAKRQAEAAAQRTTGAAAPGQQVSALPASRSSAAQPTTQSEMAGLFAGGSVYATTQLVPTRDDHWKFSADGSVEGNFSRSRRNPGLAPEFGSDHGRWWIADNRLCVQWQNWEEGKPHCYAISGTGREYVASGDGLLDGPFKLVK